MKSYKPFALVLFILSLLAVVIGLAQSLPEEIATGDTETSHPEALDPSPQIPLTIETPTPQKSLIWPQPLTQKDDQGAVSVEVTPTNLNNPIDVMYFEISLNTHSVDLSMNLAEMAILRSDNGLEIAGNVWDAALGGHHVTGILSFLISADSYSLLEEAQELTLVIYGLDASERVFVWHK